MTGIASLCACTAASAPTDDLDSEFGGTEGAILARETDWCVDLARAACALYQVSGLPSRLLFLADTTRAYSGHQLIKVDRSGAWGAVNATTGVAYRWPNRRLASVWDLMTSSHLVRDHARSDATPYTNVDHFRSAAVTSYFIWESDRYSYEVSGLNNYYTSILRMARKGWPGGLRWFYGDDEVASDAAV